MASSFVTHQSVGRGCVKSLYASCVLFIACLCNPAKVFKGQVPKSVQVSW